MSSRLYMPDGNRRYAKKKGISLLDGYVIGGERNMRLLIDFFLKPKKIDTLIFCIYTYLRKDASLPFVWRGTELFLKKICEDGVFSRNQLKFDYIAHFGELPASLEQFVRNLKEETKHNTEGTVFLLLGYSMEKDFDAALSLSSHSYADIRKHLLFQPIDIAIRTTQMRWSDGPMYALGQAQMFMIPKLSPELELADLEEVWTSFIEIQEEKKK